VEQDEAAATNEPFWDREVDRGVGCTIPFLDLDAAEVRRFAAGQLDPVPERLAGRWPCPDLLLAAVQGKAVLCLGAGGGQQSAVYGLLGAQVTVVDLSRRQLEGDRTAASHYGYAVRTLHADMRDLSCLDEETFDLVHATGLCYVPDIRQVYGQIARVLKVGGLLGFDIVQPAAFEVAWDGDAYRVMKAYHEKVNRRLDGAIEYRHYMDDVFNGLVDLGLGLLRVDDAARHRTIPVHVRPGSWKHEHVYVGGSYYIVARKAERQQGTCVSSARQRR
jgi:SAM-dependent methyltransferase